VGKRVVLLLVFLLACTSISIAEDYHPQNPEKYIRDPMVQQKFEQLERREQEKAAAQEGAARKAREAAEERAADSSRERAYAESRKARIKKLQRTRHKKVRSWQVLNR